MCTSCPSLYRCVCEQKLCISLHLLLARQQQLLLLSRPFPRFVTLSAVSAIFFLFIFVFCYSFRESYMDKNIDKRSAPAASSITLPFIAKPWILIILSRSCLLLHVRELALGTEMVAIRDIRRCSCILSRSWCFNMCCQGSRFGLSSSTPCLVLLAIFDFFLRCPSVPRSHPPFPCRHGSSMSSSFSFSLLFFLRLLFFHLLLLTLLVMHTMAPPGFQHAVLQLLVAQCLVWSFSWKHCASASCGPKPGLWK